MDLPTRLADGAFAEAIDRPTLSLSLGVSPNLKREVGPKVGPQ